MPPRILSLMQRDDGSLPRGILDAAEDRVVAAETGKYESGAGDGIHSIRPAISSRRREQDHDAITAAAANTRPRTALK